MRERLIITCPHPLTLLWFHDGELAAALCSRCAAIFDDHSHLDPAAQTVRCKPGEIVPRPLFLACREHVELPVQLDEPGTLPDGFYQLERGRWARQPEVGTHDRQPPSRPSHVGTVGTVRAGPGVNFDEKSSFWGLSQCFQHLAGI